MRTKCTCKRIDLQSISKYMWLVQEEPAQGQADHRHPEVVGRVFEMLDRRVRREREEKAIEGHGRREVKVMTLHSTLHRSIDIWRWCHCQAD